MRLKRYIKKNIKEDYADDFRRLSQRDIGEITAKADKIKKECSQILKVYKSMRKVAMRGIKRGQADYDILVKKGRVGKGRIPKDTPKNVHRWLNDMFKDKFGWPVRDGVPTTALFEQAGNYGDRYVFYPANGYKFVYSVRISDLFDRIPHNIRFGPLRTAQPGEIDSYVRGSAEELHGGKNEYAYFLELFDTYTDKNLQEGLLRSGEIFFNTKKYYLVSIFNDIALSHIHDVPPGKIDIAIGNI